MPRYEEDTVRPGHSERTGRRRHKGLGDSLLSAQADSVCAAEYGTRSPDRTNSRNGYRHRDLDTRAGTLDVAIPKLREGTFFPHWLLERHRRAEAALTTVVATCYLRGVDPPWTSWCAPWGSPDRKSVV